MHAYLNPDPTGVNPPHGPRRGILHLIAGDTLELRFHAYLQDGTPATPGSSEIQVILRSDMFGRTVWSGDWIDGVYPFGEEYSGESGGSGESGESGESGDSSSGVLSVLSSEGLLVVIIPPAVTGEFMRGSYFGSIRIQDRGSSFTRTLHTFHILVDYAATSPNRDLPYRGASRKFNRRRYSSMD